MSAKRKIALMTVATLLLAALWVQPASAWSLYAGNSRSSGYGVKGYVGTPSQQPAIFDWIASWVSTAGPDWVQTGWAMYPGWAYPKSFVEANVGGLYDVIWYSDQAYNYSRLYEVVAYDNDVLWRALIQGTSRGVWGPISSPREVQAFSEVQRYATSQLKGTFSSIQYKGLYSYMNFNQDNRRADSPYWIEYFYPYQYNTHGNGM